ncbi:uncharacterized protein LOC129947210 [Eupeodes corollae]|uniref:uncharacterized protein LOC129947210 n=1 Tax=Eupeodes corollae TaxID=290404 RepID=UPI002492C4D7|nr:uncharacterized protein LOC129947210 [Eupeodes corollae]
MKVLLCLTAIVCTCSGGITSGYDGNSIVKSIEIEPQQLQHIHQVQVIEQGQHGSEGVPIELFDSQNVQSGAEFSGGFSGSQSGGQSGWQPIADIHSQNSEPEIIKIIHEQAPNTHGRHAGFETQSHQQFQHQIIQIIEEPSFGSNHQGGNHHQIIKVIEEHPFSGHGGGSSGSSGHGGHGNSHAFEPNFGGHGSPSQSEPQIIFADPPSIPFPSSSDTSSKSLNPLSSLGSVIPQILKFLFGGGGESKSLPLPSLSGHKAINTPHAGKLTNAYGYGGTAKISKGGKLHKHFYNSGRVIERGTLKISSVKKGKW